MHDESREIALMIPHDDIKMQKRVITRYKPAAINVIRCAARKKDRRTRFAAFYSDADPTGYALSFSFSFRRYLMGNSEDYTRSVYVTRAHTRFSLVTSTVPREVDRLLTSVCYIRNHLLGRTRIVSFIFVLIGIQFLLLITMDLCVLRKCPTTDESSAAK